MIVQSLKPTVHRKFVLPLFLLLVSLLFSHYYAFGEEPTIRIGAILSETGHASYLGSVEKKTLLMAEKEINGRGGIGGRELEFVFLDNESDVILSTLVTEKLLGEDEILAIIGPPTSEQTLAVADLFERAQVPLISLAPSMKIVTPVRKWIFKSAPSMEHAIRRLLSYIKEFGIEQIGIITSKNGYGRTGKGLIYKVARELGLRITGHVLISQRDRNVTGKLETLMGTGPDGIVCWATGRIMASVARGRGELEIEIPLYAGPLASTSSFMKQAGSASDGIILSATGMEVPGGIQEGTPHNIAISRFNESYVRSFKKRPPPYAGRAWDAILLLTRAIENTYGLSRAGIRMALERIRDFPATGGVYSFSPTDHDGLGISSYGLYQISVGSLKRIE
jgi:branched-chain amino acid transport system substrate-binding protein